MPVLRAVRRYPSPRSGPQRESLITRSATNGLVEQVSPGCGLWVVGCGLWVVGCGLWVVGCGLRANRVSSSPRRVEIASLDSGDTWMTRRTRIISRTITTPFANSQENFFCCELERVAADRPIRVHLAILLHPACASLKHAWRVFCGACRDYARREAETTHPHRSLLN
jgi:hypothetical protein